MTAQEYKDFIKEKLESIENKIDKQFEKYDKVSDKVIVHEEKIKNLSKIIWISVTAVTGAIGGVFIVFLRYILGRN
jgi:hypothetical protein